MVSPVARAEAFCARFGLRLPVLLAPMSGVPSIPLASAVAAA
ncbi:nitronate monooxygenase, partial [Endobacter medicaginis]|nr:nitronate monooxygenase [Endobacter medicaginis]